MSTILPTLLGAFLSPLLFPASATAAARVTAPTAVEVVAAYPFELALPYRYGWSADQPMVSEGLLVVLRSAAAAPREVEEPLLYAGARPMERLSWSPSDDYVVAIIPGPIDLLHTPLYWGRPALAEQQGPVEGALEEAAARAAGIQPISSALLAKRTGSPLPVASAEALLCEAATLVIRWAPADAARARGWQMAPACR